MAWEYKMVYVGMDTVDEDQYEARLHDSLHTLNDLGREGWDLICYLPHHVTGKLNKYHAVLKRQI